MIFHPIAYFGFCFRRFFFQWNLGVCGLKAPLRSIWILPTSPTSNYLSTCSLLQASLLCLPFPTQDFCTWCSLCLTQTCPRSSQGEFLLLILVLAQMPFAQWDPAWRPPSLSVIVPKTFCCYFHRLTTKWKIPCVFIYLQSVLEYKLDESRDPVHLAECVFLLSRRVPDT